MVRAFNTFISAIAGISAAPVKGFFGLAILRNFVDDVRSAVRSSPLWKTRLLLAGELSRSWPSSSA